MRLFVPDVLIKMMPDMGYSRVNLTFTENCLDLYYIQYDMNDEMLFIEPFDFVTEYSTPGEHHGIKVLEKIIIASDSKVRIKQVEKYLKLLNVKLKEGMYNEGEQIELIVQSIRNEALPIAMNYIRTLPETLTLAVQKLEEFEAMLCYADVHIRIYSSIDVKEREIVANRVKEDIEQREIFLNSYISNFDKYVKFIHKRFSAVTDRNEYIIAWILFQEALITYYSKVFESKFPLFNAELELNSLNEYVRIFCNDISTSNDKHTINLFHLFLLDKQIIKRKNSIVSTFNEVENFVADVLKDRENERFEALLLGNTSFDKPRYSIDDVDLMNGSEFESFVSSLFSKMGYITEVTKQSGDQGLDVIAEKQGKRLGIQAKCYSNTVGNSAIQEAVAGMNYYHCDKVIVVTNNFFTNAAIELAKANNVVLWDRNLLKEKIIELF
jgi:HJR/Mrr/RecB family endonuclease